jgi:pimeloyl-ACP methyl ester carboxylesterase
MATWEDVDGSASVAPLWGELRYGGELARLLAGEALSGRAMRRPRRDGQPVLLIPGFMSGDSSLTVMRSWLRSRGHSVAMSGMRLNAGCAEEIVSRLQVRVREFAERQGEPVVVIGQSRGGALARSLAVREPEHISALVMLGSPVSDPLAVSPRVLRTIRLMATLGDLGVRSVFSSDCGEGACCERHWEDLEAPLPAGMRAISVFSRSDGIVDWHACMDPHARNIEVSSSHCGMSVHPAVYRVLEELLEDSREAAWSG